MIQIFNIERLRKAKGWTQEMLAEMSGVHRVSIARYETTDHDMTLKTARKLADALGCTVNELMEGSKSNDKG